MKDIVSLILHNFQQWKSGNITFTKGLNILVGDTECGKSTLFRAISSILTGKMPEDYIRKGCKDTSVELKFSDKTVFKRRRSNKENIICSNNTVYERVGKEIPSQYFIDLGPTSITFGDKKQSLCLYSQFDPHFFITLSDYDKSKLIGSICGIDIVDKVVDRVNKDIRQANSNIKFITEQLDNDNKLLELKQPELDNKTLICNNLSNIVDNVNKSVDKLNKLVKINQELLSLNTLISECETNKNLFKRILDTFNFKESIDLLTKLVTLKTHISDINFNIYSINKNIEDKLYTFDIQSLKNKINLLDDLVYCQEALLKLKLNISNLEHDLHANSIELDNLHKEKEALLSDYDTCPLCGSVINEK